MTLTGSKGPIFYQKHPVAAGAVFAEDDMIMVGGDGYVRPAAALAGNRGVVAVSVEAVDNSGGADGDLEVLGAEGVFIFTGTFTVADNMTTMYADTDTTTLSGTPVANWPAVGRGRFLNTGEMAVKVSPESAALPVL